MSVHWPMIRRCLRSPGATLMIDDRRRWKAAEILFGAMRLADELESRSGTQTLALLLPTSAMTPMAMLAGWILGRTVVPLNYLLKPDELQYVIDDCGADTIVAVQPMLDFLGHTPRVKNILRLEDVDFSGIPSVRWPSLRGVGDPDELAAMLYTSGTSGRPKGVMLTHRNLSTNVRQCVKFVQFDHNDSFVGVLPQFHSFGLTVLTVLPLIVGARAIYSARFVPKRIVELIREHRPTAFVAIPSMYGALLSVKDASPDDFQSIRYLVSGGEALPQSTFERFEERFGKRICEGYGLTETAPVTNWLRPSEFRRGSVGRALPGVEQRIIDPATGATLGPDSDGEIRIRGDNVMPGYYQLPEENEKAFDEHGFFRTGDMGRMDRDGFLYITGRIKEMLIVGGENVFPREIEEAIESHNAVNAAGVVGVQDGVRGELPVAFVELIEGMSATESEIRSWCRERIAGYKVPREVRFLDELPRNPTGKVLRRELKAMIEQQQGAPQAGS